MGFQAILLKNGQIVVDAAGGKARNAADGVVAMTTSNPANVGSTDTPILTFFPAIWQ